MEFVEVVKCMESWELLSLLFCIADKNLSQVTQGEMFTDETWV